MVRLIALKSDQIEASDRLIVVVLIESQSEVRFLEQRFGQHLCRTLKKRTKVMIHFGVDTFDTMEAVCSGLNRALRLLNFDAVFNNFWSSYAALKINIDKIC